MLITIFYNSDNNSTNLVCPLMSRANDGLAFNIDMSNLKLEYINLKKRNFKKYLSKQRQLNQLPSIIYVFVGDLHETAGYIESEYPDVGIRVYGDKNVFTSNQSLEECIIFDYAYTLPEKDYYVVHTCTNGVDDFRVEKIVTNEVAIKKIKRNDNNTVFDSEKEAWEYRLKKLSEYQKNDMQYLNYLKARIPALEDSINERKSLIEQCEAFLTEILQ